MIQDKKIVCIDVESNGFRGEAFAVGAVVMDMEGNIPQAYLCRTFLTGHPVQFVVEKVLPALAEVKNTHTKARDMRVDFMRWHAWVSTQYDIVTFADWTYPVDGRFLISAQDEIPSSMDYRISIVHEAATLLLALGMDVDLDRYEFVKDEMKGEKKKHNPLWDAEVSARTIRKLLLMLEERRPTSTATINTPYITKGVETGRTQALKPNVANTPKGLAISHPIEAVPYHGSEVQVGGNAPTIHVADLLHSNGVEVDK